VVADRPLADVTVLSVEQFGAGPWGTLQLADLGADVIAERIGALARAGAFG
jgi:crotonobetainyl-CoA:carnitine CoA-transferase CaiB-like acyl-CoA transferase